MILSHRGLWKTPEEKNTLNAFKASFQKGFGIESDIRDYNSKLVISHDVPQKDGIQLDEVLKIYSNNNFHFHLALNIKSCGLSLPLLEKIKKFGIKNYFVFDMAIPDYFEYISNGLNFFTRQSEYEKEPAFYEPAQGVWIDAFISIWYDSKIILEHVNNDKDVCIVSPELHHREYIPTWNMIKNITDKCDIQQRILLCTDYPEQAQRFFNDKN